jgi:hypothetical protein
MHAKLLIVDDDPNTCMQMKWALAEDFEVLVAHNRGRRLWHCSTSSVRRW